MANQIPGKPNDYNFGLEFDYSVWTPNTTIDLVNVPWNNDYRDVVRFDTPQLLDDYIDSLRPAGIRIDQLSYVKPNTPVRVAIPHNRAIKYNYLRAQNPVQPIDGDDVAKSYYYFIIDVRYVAPNTTELVLQLDVWQTYVYDVVFGNCYLERGHIAIANEKAADNWGRDYLTTPEGLEVGSEYRTVNGAFKQLMGQLAGANQDILVASTTDLLADAGTATAPLLKTAKGGMAGGLPSGASFYIFDSAGSFQTWLTAMQDKPWVTQGIISATVIPNMSEFGYDVTLTPNVPNPMPAGLPQNRMYTLVNKWRDVVKAYIPRRYRHLEKFMTSPYTSVTLTTYTGNPIALKPELIQHEDMRVTEYISLLPPGQKMSAHCTDYNGTGRIIGENLDVATHLGQFPTLAVVNNGAINYLASNRNSLIAQRNNADWSQQRALAMAEGQYDIASGAMRQADESTLIGAQADWMSTKASNQLIQSQAMANALGGIGGGGISGALAGPGGVGAGVAGGGVQGVVGAVNAGSQMSAANEQQAIRNSTSWRSLENEQQQRGLTRDTNKSLSDFAAKGDYRAQILGINAKIADANLIQPTVSGQMGGEILNYLNQFMGITVKLKLIDQAAIRVIGELWLRYGYATRAFIRPPASLHVMDKFTYWKMTETYISAATVPESFKNVLRGILEKGVTNWRNPADIGMIDIADNRPLEGISY